MLNGRRVTSRNASRLQLLHIAQFIPGEMLKAERIICKDCQSCYNRIIPCHGTLVDIAHVGKCPDVIQ